MYVFAAVANNVGLNHSDVVSKTIPNNNQFLKHSDLDSQQCHSPPKAFLATMEWPAPVVDVPVAMIKVWCLLFTCNV